MKQIYRCLVSETNLLVDLHPETNLLVGWSQKATYLLIIHLRPTYYCLVSKINLLVGWSQGNRRLHSGPHGYHGASRLSLTQLEDCIWRDRPLCAGLWRDWPLRADNQSFADDDALKLMWSCLRPMIWSHASIVGQLLLGIAAYTAADACAALVRWATCSAGALPRLPIWMGLPLRS